MDDEVFALAPRPSAKKVFVSTPRDLLTIGFRRRRLLVACAAATVVVTVLAAWILPRYKGESKLMLVTERVDPVTTAGDGGTAVMAQPIVTDEELKSEVEVLSSYDLLTEVVRAAHPEHTSEKHPLSFLFAWQRWFSTPEQREAALVQKLNNDLSAAVVKGSNVILVEYKNHDPQVAKRVLEKLVDLYLQRHLAVHRPVGEYQFFQQQTDQYKQNLNQAEAALSGFSGKYGAVNPAADRDIVLQKLNEFKSALHQTDVSISDGQSRVKSLEQQLASTPTRVTTQLKRADNPQLLQQLKSTLLDLQLKRVDLLAKFQPSYRPVQEIEAQIADTKASIQAQESAPVQESTTDLDSTHSWIVNELAKAKVDLAGAQASKITLAQTVGAYEAAAAELDRKAVIQHDLQRDASAEESKYLMYLRKREEARVNDALDRQRLFNVVVAEPPTVPALPSHSPAQFAFAGFLGMSFLTCCLFVTLDWLDPTLRSRSEIESVLSIPVLAAIPRQRLADGGFQRFGQSERTETLDFS